MLNRRFRRNCEAVFEPDADSAYWNDLANEIAEVKVRGALQDRGYFNATEKVKLTPLKTEGTDISVVVTISATPGLQYRTGDIRIKSSDSDNPLAISLEILRSLIPLQRGEVFSTDFSYCQGCVSSSMNMTRARG